MSQVSIFCILAPFLALCFIHNANCVHITLSPANPTESVERSVEIKCTPGSSASKYSDVLAVSVIKDDKSQIAVMKPGNRITFLHDNVEQRFKATGHLSEHDGLSTTLTLTLLLPRVEDSGDYACVYSYFDSDGLPQQDKSSRTLRVDEPSGITTYLEALVENLVRRVEALERESLKNAACCSSG